ncbi:MAG: DUF58 domain-containing protein [Flavobacteriales bacterium]
MATRIEQQRLSQFSHLELLAKEVVEGFITGMHKSPFHGFSVEFAEHRAYNPGESTRHIDWKLYARTEKLFVKRYEEETNLRGEILVDASSSMNFPDEKGRERFNKLEFAVHAAAALVTLLRKQRDAVGLSIFSDQLELLTEARVNAAHMRFIFQQLEQLLNTERERQQKRTNVTGSLHQIAERIHKRSLVILFSDMMDNSEEQEELFSALQHLRHNKHEVLLFHVMDAPYELNFELENRPYSFIDLETGEEVKANPNEVREHYTERMHEFHEQLRTRCHQYGVDFVPCDISRGFDTVLWEYLNKRSRLY